MRTAPSNLHRLTSVEQVRKFVKEHDSLKVLGTRHCFNGIADSHHALISLKPMDQVVALDPKARTVTVEAGMTYGRLCPYLHEQGFALHNLASLPHISIAGACATATHGSGIKNGNLATAVSALELVTANGELLTLSRERDGDTFLGAVVNLGALGVMTKVTLDVQPTFTDAAGCLRESAAVATGGPLRGIMSSGYSVSLFTDWQNKRINEVWIKRRVEKGGIAVADPGFHGARLATRNLHPIAELSAENCTEQMGVPGPWYDRLPHFRIVVLAGVDQHHVGPSRFQRVHDRLDLHEVGARACHADDLQDFRRFTRGCCLTWVSIWGYGRRRCGGTVEVAGGGLQAGLPPGQRREARARA